MIARWVSDDHVHLAAVRALCLHWSAYTGDGGLMAGDPYRPARRPVAASLYGGPSNALPVNGDIYTHSPLSGDSTWAVPWIAVYLSGANPTGIGTDQNSTFRDVRVTVRARYGLDDDSVATRIARTVSEAGARYLARAAQRVIADKIAITAAALDPDGSDGTFAFGVFTPMEMSEVTTEQAPTAPGVSQGRAVFDALATVTVRQSQYRSAGTDGT